MKVFVTGATGFIGEKLALKLAEEGYDVHALCRSFEKGKGLIHNNIHLFKGDLLDLSSLENAMQDCEAVFHLAGYARMWSKDPQTFYRVNVQGSLNVLNVAKKIGVRRFIYTSTIAKYNPQASDEINENAPTAENYPTLYAETKDKAEKALFKNASDNIDVIIINTSRVFGPGILSESNGITRMIKWFYDGKFHFIPGKGDLLGNYVFIDDVVNGHILTLKNGRRNENYILGGENISFNEFFARLNLVNESKHRMFHIPISLLLLIAYASEIITFITKRPPLIDTKWIRHYLKNWNVSSSKAIDELGYHITPLDQGLKKTITWLRQSPDF